MMLYVLGLLVLAIYCFLISLQFGSGIFLGLFGYSEARSQVILKYLSPVTAITNTFLVVYALLLIATYPQVASLFGTTLLVPIMLGITFLGLQLFALMYLGLVRDNHRGYRLLLAISSLLAPIFLISYLAVSMHNRLGVTETGIQSSLGSTFSDPMYLWLALLALLHITYFTALFFSYHPREEAQRTFFAAVRRIAAVLTPLATYFWLWQFRDLYVVHHLISAIWWLPAIALLGYVIAFFIASPWLHLAHFLLLFLWYAIGMYPYIMYPHIRVTDITNPVMYQALLWGIAGGLVILVPSLLYLVRVVRSYEHRK